MDGLDSMGATVIGNLTCPAWQLLKKPAVRCPAGPRAEKMPIARNFPSLRLLSGPQVRIARLVFCLDAKCGKR